MDEFYSWLKKHQALVLPQSSLGKAFAYAIKYEAGLCRYLEDGRLEIDNNHTEREIKPVVIAHPTYIDETLLHHAAWTGNVAMMEYIQSTWPQNAHAQDIYGRSVLHFAAASGNPSALDFVIETYR
eukprot:gene9769-18298_t